MKLYLIPSACSLAAHIAVREANLDVELIKVDLNTKKLADGTDYATISPKGQVSAMTLENGELLTENIAVLIYLASRAQPNSLLPAITDPEYFRTLEWLTFIATEVHKQIFWTYFNNATPETYRQYVLSLLPVRFDTLEARLSTRDFLAASQFTIADAYLAWALHFIELLNVSIDDWPALNAYKKAIFARPSVIQSLALEAQ